MKAIEKTFPNSHNIIYIWNINKAIMARCKRAFETEEKWVKFFTLWIWLVESATEGSLVEDYYIQILMTIYYSLGCLTWSFL
ncbi:hypothetical protein BY996DRAFT_7191981 [Phakopsora pachyrhizi]|nr:hypothetical protein BY996DRAFT_7191981 [Phakopsora pachyrhizi]